MYNATFETSSTSPNREYQVLPEVVFGRKPLLSVRAFVVLFYNVK